MLLCWLIAINVRAIRLQTVNSLYIKVITLLYMPRLKDLNKVNTLFKLPTTRKQLSGQAYGILEKSAIASAKA